MIIDHVIGLIGFQIKVIGLHLTERLTMEDWLAAYALPDSAMNRQRLEKRLKVLLEH